MFNCTRFETKQIMEGKASGCVRQYGNECPHKPGMELWLTSKTLDMSGADRSIPFARAKVASVRPGTIGEFKRDQMIAGMDGYANGEHWIGQMKLLYPGIKETDKVFHIKFALMEIDREAGRRSDRGEAEANPEDIVG